MSGLSLDPPGDRPSSSHTAETVSRTISPYSSRTMSGSPIEIDLTNSDGENAGNEPRSKGKGRAHPMLPIEIADTPSPAATQAEYDMDDEDIPLPTAEDVEEEDSDLLEVEIITRQEFENHTRYAAGNELPFNHEIAPYAPLLGNGRLEAGQDVELIDGDFLRVTHIVRDKALPRADPLAYILRGILLRRQRSLDNMFSRTTNELAAIILVPMDDNRPHFVSGLEDRPLTSFVCIREIVFTNAIFPQFSFRNLEGAARKFFRMPCGDGPLAMTYLKKDKAVEEARLVCRMKVVKRYIMDGKREKLVSNAFRRLLPDEADPKYRKSPVELFREWREGWREQTDRPKAAAASRKASDLSITPASSRKRSADVIILDDSDDDKLSSAKPSQTPILKTYSLFDFFCGSGGVSEAARLAGLNVKYAIDNQKCAVRTHQKNHRRCTTMHNDVADFIAMVKPGEIQVDVIHSSNPCRYWSFNHTIAGKDDEMNEAIAYTAEEAGKKFRPRIFTFEQTPGLCGIEKHRANWQLFMRQLTSVGYDVEWRVISFADYGNPQARKRLIIFAACPGQQLPEFPCPTHGKPGTGLRGYKTVNETIGNMPRGITFHNPDVMREKHRNKPYNMPPAAGHLPLSHLVDRAGPHALHPNGKRQFTLREVLRLQGFPDTYQYASDTPGKPITHRQGLKMAGDAVPPKAFKPFMEECKKALEKTDKAIAEYVPPPPIVIDD